MEPGECVGSNESLGRNVRLCNRPYLIPFKNKSSTPLPYDRAYHHKPFRFCGESLIPTLYYKYNIDIGVCQLVLIVIYNYYLTLTAQYVIIIMRGTWVRILKMRPCAYYSVGCLCYSVGVEAWRSYSPINTL